MSDTKAQKPGAPARAKHPIGTLKRLFGYFRFNKKLLLFGLMLSILSTVAEVGLNGMLSPIIDSVVVDRNIALFVRMLLLTAGIMIFASAGKYFGMLMIAKLSQDTVYIIRQELNDKILHLPVAYYDSVPHGQTMSTFTNDVDALSQSLDQGISQFILSGITFVGTFVMMFWLSWRLTLIVIAFFGVLFLVIRFIASHSQRYYRNRQEMTADLNGYVEELISAQKVVKVFNHEQEAIEAFDEKAEALRIASTRAQTFGAMTMPVMGNLSYVMYAVVAMFGAFQVIGRRMTIGNITAYLQYTRNITRPVTELANQLNMIFSAIAGAERIFTILDLDPEKMDGDVRLARTEDGELVWRIPSDDGILEQPVHGDVRFHDVSFGYTPDQLVLRDISLYAKPGQKIAFVGSTGAGKTTLTNLINRFYDINAGQITLDGVSLSRIDKTDLRSIMSVVLQDVHLFSDTIAENIRYGRLDATDEEVIEAAISANAHPFISKLEAGYETPVADDGAGLSQGERQLLSIARAAIADPVILIMDEATSSVDTRTEALIAKGMDALMKNRTTFVIAHRLSTVRDADAIIVLEHGRIVERGDHDELMALRGRYYDLNVGKAELD